MNKELRRALDLSDKHLMLFLLMNEWVKVKQKNRSVAKCLIERDIRRVAIYGMSYCGQRLCDELDDSDVEIVGCLDQKNGGVYLGHRITAADKIPENVDAIIVTPIFYFDEIRKKLEEKTASQIISLEEIIYGIGEE